MVGTAPFPERLSTRRGRGAAGDPARTHTDRGGTVGKRWSSHRRSAENQCQHPATERLAPVFSPHHGRDPTCLCGCWPGFTGLLANELQTPLVIKKEEKPLHSYQQVGLRDGHKDGKPPTPTPAHLPHKAAQEAASPRAMAWPHHPELGRSSPGKPAPPARGRLQPGAGSPSSAPVHL